MIIGIIVAAGAAALVLTARESARAAADDGKNGQAWGTAMAGLSWAQLHLDDNTGKAALQAAAAGTTTAAAGMNIHPFNADDAFAGIGVAPPARGVSNANWRAFDNGHFGLIGTVDPLSTASVVVRAVGRTGESQVVLETNLTVNVLKALPAGLVGCFAGTTQITYFDEESPYDYYGNMRYDGNGGVPIGMSADHDRINGLARNTENGAIPPPDLSPADPTPGYPTGLRWRGTQSLRGEPLAAAIPGIAPSVTTAVGGTPLANMQTDNIGPLAGWDGNPYIANDPRLVYFQNTALTTDKTMAFGLNSGGLVDGLVTDGLNGFANPQRGLPIIGYIGTPNNVSDAQGGFRGEEDWAPFNKDDRARKGFYGCDNHNGTNGALNNAANVCMTGVLGANPNWTSNGLFHSGRSWGFLSSIIRHCSGSGDAINPVTGDPWQSALLNPNGVRCAPAFEYLENVAACLVIPRAVANQRGTSAFRPSGIPTETPGGDNNHGNDFAGCHPGCLLAADFDDSGAADTPYRSVCINVDATVVSSYGPDILSAKNHSPVVAQQADSVNRWAAYAVLKNPAEFPERLPLDAVGPFDKDDVTHDVAIDAAGGVIKRPGYVSERGNPSLITRFDMTDRGPLGTCQQNCLAYGFGKDRTYGAHRGAGEGAIGTAAEPDACRAKVPIEPNGAFRDVHCNVDYDRDGFYDRKTYAISTSFREECVDTHDGVSWAPTFNISSTNPTIAGAGCLNVLPSDHPDAPPVTLTPFCDQGALAEIESAVDGLLATATTVTTANLGQKTILKDGVNWFGGAKCHMGNIVTTYKDAADVTVPNPVNHPHSGTLSGIPSTDVDAFDHPDYWIQDECPDPKVIRLDPGASLTVGHICGCGVLVLKDTRLTFGDGGHLLWRGLVVWQLENVTGNSLTANGGGFASFVVDGGVMATGDQDWKIVITKVDEDAIEVTNDDGNHFKHSFRNNPLALTEALAGQTTALKAVRRVR